MCELLRVRESGVGAHIDVSMLGSTLPIAALQTSEFFDNGRDRGKLGSAHPRNAPYQAFKVRDTYFGMTAGIKCITGVSLQIDEASQIVLRRAILQYERSCASPNRT